MPNDGLTLYEVETELMESFQQVQALQESGNEDDLATALACLEAYIKESVAKRDRVGKFLETLESTEASIDSEIKRLQDRKKRIERTRESMCSYILMIMSKIGVTKLEGTLFSFKARKNPVSVVIESEASIPAEFMRQPDPPAPKPDKKAIKEALQAGAVVPGARLTQETRLVIDQ